MKFRYLTFLWALILCQAHGQTSFSNADVLADLKSLQKVIEDGHYKPFAYTTKETFIEIINENRESILKKDSLSLLEATSLLQRVASSINNGHTYIDFPIQAYIEYAQSGGTLFPFELAFEEENAFIRKNWSGDSSISVGDEVLSVNGKSIEEIITTMSPYIAAEREYFKKAKIEFYSFPRWYWQVFGKQETYEVKIKQGDVVRSFTLKPINVIEDFEVKRTEVFQSNPKLDFFENSAYLNPGEFSGDQNLFKSFIDSSFTEIKKTKCKNLIIDLRNNTGGNDSFSDYMVSYLANKPFKWNSSFNIKISKQLKESIRNSSDTISAYFKKVLKQVNGGVYTPDFDMYTPQKKSKRFKGKTFVLVNRQSYSQAAVTAAQLQDYGWATIVGEETGEYPSLYASVFQYTLPKTGIVVNISKGHIIRVNGSTKKEGVIPDIKIRDHLLDEKDEIFNGLFEIINK